MTCGRVPLLARLRVRSGGPHEHLALALHCGGARGDTFDALRHAHMDVSRIRVYVWRFSNDDCDLEGMDPHMKAVTLLILSALGIMAVLRPSLIVPVAITVLMAAYLRHENRRRL